MSSLKICHFDVVALDCQVMKKICDHPSLLTKRAANDIAEGMEGYLDTEDIQAAEAMTRSLAGMVEEDENMGARSCKIDFLMALLVMSLLLSSSISSNVFTCLLLFLNESKRCSWKILILGIFLRRRILLLKVTVHSYLLKLERC